MCRQRSIAMRDYQESVTTGQTDRWTDGQTDAGQSDPCVLLCFTDDKSTQTDRWTDRSQTKLSLCAAMLCRRHKNQLSEIFGKESREFELVATGGIYPIKMTKLHQPRWQPWPLICRLPSLCFFE